MYCRESRKMTSLWLLISILVKFCATIPMSSREGKITDETQVLINDIVSTYFSEAQCIGIITERPGIYLKDVDLPLYYITLKNNDAAFEDLVLTAADDGCRAFVLQVKDVTRMIQTFSELSRSAKSQYRQNRRYIYLPPHFGYNGHEWESVMNDVFSSKAMDWMPDLVIVNYIFKKEALHMINTTKQMNHSRRHKSEPQVPFEADFIFEMYTHRFVGKTPSEKVFLDTWLPGHGFVYGNNLFYDKLHDLMGKEIKISALPYSPFSVMILDTEPPIFDGLEFQPMFEFGKKYNATFKVGYDLEVFWGEIWENGSGNGILGAVAEDRADFAFSAIYLWEREYFFIDYSVCHYDSGLTVVTPKPKPLPGWLIPVLPFNSYMWYAVLASIVFITLVLYVVSKSSQALLGSSIASRYSTLTECGFRTTGLLVLQIPDDERDYATPRYIPMRHLVTWVILFFLVISSAYGGSLSAILTLPQFELPIDTPEDLAESGLNWYGYAEAFVFSFKATSDPLMQTLAQNYVLRPEERLKELAFDDIALTVERLQGGHIVEVSYIFEEMMKNKRIMREYLASSHCVFVLRKGSAFKENFNRLLLKLSEAGMQMYWERITVLKFQSQRLQQTIINSRMPPEVQRTKLAFSHVQGAFYILILGLILAAVTFLLEFLRFRSAEKKKHFN